jgi:lipoprotein-anchoring transpeptidase ErfK/SrfK
MTAIAATAAARAPSRHWGGRLAILLTGLVVLTALGAAGAGVTVHHRQQDQLASAQSDRLAAVHALDAAVAAAIADGVPAADLAPVRAQRAAILAEADVAPRLHWFDNGQIGRLRDQAGRLRSVLATIPALEAAAVDADAKQAGASLDAFAQVLGQARAIGVDVSALEQTVARERAALAAAFTPLLVSAAVGDVPTLITQVQQSITDRQAAIAAAAAAAAAAKALLDGARADAQDALARADSLLAQVTAFPQLQTGGDPQTIAAAHQRIGLAQTVDDFRAVSSLLGPAIGDLNSLLHARSDAYSAMASARGVVTAAQQNKIDASAVAQQLDGLQPQLDTAGTTAAFSTVSGQINAAVSPLQAELARATVGVGKVILISLANQSLTAYQDGVQYLHTLVTTGRPSLPTPPGTYSVLRKNTPWLMRSEYPPGSPGYYTPSWVSWVLWFRSDGYGIHDAPWRGTYGPGTQVYGSHGCVNVPHSSMAQLFGWADLGIKVIVV